MWERYIYRLLPIHFPDQGSKLQPRYVPWLELNLQPFAACDHPPNNWAIQARLDIIFRMLVIIISCICSFWVYSGYRDNYWKQIRHFRSFKKFLDLQSNTLKIIWVKIVTQVCLNTYLHKCFLLSILLQFSWFTSDIPVMQKLSSSNFLCS